MLRDKPFVVVENYFSPTEYALIKRRVDNSELTFTPHISGINKESLDILNDTGFACNWFKDVKHLGDEQFVNKHPVITELIHTKIEQHFKISKMLRVRLGTFIPSGAEHQIHDPHIDYFCPHYVGLLYTCTEKDAGHTYLWDEYYDPFVYATAEEQMNVLGDRLSPDKAIKVSPKENTMIFFRGDMFHASSKPQSIVRRTAININFEGWPRDV